MSYSPHIPEPLRYDLDFAPACDGVSGTVTHAVLVDGTPLERRNHYVIGHKRITEAFGLFLPAYLLDAIDLAVAVYVADRLSPRRRPDVDDPYGLQWRRHITIHLPVREPQRWNQPNLYANLRALLEHFTDDCWSFDFVPRCDNSVPYERQFPLFPLQPPQPLEIALFSGGLDSLAGIAHRLASDPSLSVVSVAVGTNGRTIGRQRELHRALSRTFGNRIGMVVVPVRVAQRQRADLDDEPTQRSRGFIYLTLAAVAAVQAGQREVCVYENGVGAISLPYSRAQLGAQNTRAVHPLSLIGMSDFFCQIVGYPFRFRNPCLFETKGLMCRKLADIGLGALAARSVSCDTFSSQRIPGAQQCEVCSSCLLRRQALHAAGLQSIDAMSGYRVDVAHPGESLESQQLYHLHAMLDQAMLVRACVTGASAWAELSERFPVLEEITVEMAAFEGRTARQITDALVELYRSYVQEWDSFPYHLARHMPDDAHLAASAPTAPYINTLQQQ